MFKRMAAYGLQGPLPKSARMELLVSPPLAIRSTERMEVFVPPRVNLIAEGARTIGFVLGLAMLLATIGPLMQGVLRLDPVLATAALACAVSLSLSYWGHRTLRKAATADTPMPYFDRIRGVLGFPVEGADPVEVPWSEVEGYIDTVMSRYGSGWHQLAFARRETGTGEWHLLPLLLDQSLNKEALLGLWSFIARFMAPNAPLPNEPYFWTALIWEKYPDEDPASENARNEYLDRLNALYALRRRAAGVESDLGLPPDLDPASPTCKYPDLRAALPEARVAYQAHVREVMASLAERPVTESRKRA